MTLVVVVVVVVIGSVVVFDRSVAPFVVELVVAVVVEWLCPVANG